MARSVFGETATGGRVAGGGDAGGYGQQMEDPNDPNAAKRAAAVARVRAQNQAMRDRDPYGAPLTAGAQQQALLPGYDQRMDMIGGMLGGAQGRQAPQAQGSTIAAMQQAGGANLGAAASAQGSSLGSAAQAGSVNFGPAGAASAGKLGAAERAQAAQIGALERAQDSSFRQGQQQTADFLSGLMGGQNSIAALQGQRMADQAMAAQRSMAASARPGQGGMAARLAAQNMGKISGDIAARTQEAQLAERMAAAGQLGQLLGTARGQDLGLNQFNAGQANAQNLAQAQLQQQAALQNAAQANQQAQVGAQLGTQASIANAANQTQMGIAQGQMAGQLGMFNAGQTNAQALAAAQMAQQNSQFNTGQQNAQAQLAAQLAQQNNQFNTQATNQAALEQARLAQQNNQFNVGANLQQAGMNDQFMMGLLGQQLGTQQLQQQGSQFGMSLEQQRYLQNQQLDAQRAMLQMQINAQKAAQGGGSFLDKLGSGILGLGASVLPMVIGGAVGGPAGAAIGAGIGGSIGGAMNTGATTPNLDPYWNSGWR